MKPSVGGVWIFSGTTQCEREESKMAASWWVYKAPVGKGLIAPFSDHVTFIYLSAKVTPSALQ